MVYYSLCENIIIEDLEDSDVYLEFAELFSQSTDTYDEIYTTQKIDEISTTQKIDEISTTQKYNEILTTTESLMIVSVSTTKTTSQISTMNASSIKTTTQKSTTKSVSNEEIEKEGMSITENQFEDLKPEERFEVDTFEDYFAAEWENMLKNGSLLNGKNTKIPLKTQFQNQTKLEDIDIPIPTSWSDWFTREADYEFQEIENENSSTDITYNDQFEINFEKFWDVNDARNLNVSNVDTKMEPQIEMSTTSFEAISVPSSWFDWFKSEIILNSRTQEIEDLEVDSIYEDQFEIDYENFWDNHINDIPYAKPKSNSKTLKPKQNKQFDSINISGDVLQWFKLEGNNMNEEKNVKMDEYRVYIEHSPNEEIKKMINDLEGKVFLIQKISFLFCYSFLMVLNSSAGKSAQLFVIIYNASVLN